MDKDLGNLSSDEGDLDIQAPVSWSDWVNVFTFLSTPVNRIVLFARAIANVKRAAGESGDTYGLRVTQAYARRNRRSQTHCLYQRLSLQACLADIPHGNFPERIAPTKSR